MRLISMPPGLGDSAWILMKLINANERFVFRIPGAQPQRGKQLFDLLPQISERAFYDPGMRFKQVKLNNASVEITQEYIDSIFYGRNFDFNALIKRSWGSINVSDIYLEANNHLENGNRIEGFLYDLPTSFTLNFQTTEEDKKRAAIIGGGKMIGIYCASYAGSRNWGTWLMDEWLCLIRLLNEHFKNSTFVIIGAPYDDLTADLFQRLSGNFSVINTVGFELGATIEVLKRLDFFIGFPSGLSIINELCGAKKTFMFYSKAIKKIINTWGDPKRIESGELKECVFCQPEKAFEWIKDNWAI